MRVAHEHSNYFYYRNRTIALYKECKDLFNLIEVDDLVTSTG